MHIQSAHSRRGHPDTHAVGSVCEDDGHSRAEHDSGRISPADNIRLFASTLAVSRSGATRICAKPATDEPILFTVVACLLMASSTASGPSSMPPVIWPRSDILQRMAVSVVPRILESMTSIAESMATRGSPRPRRMCRSMGVLDDVALGREVGQDVDRRVGYENDFGIARHAN